MAKQKQKKTNKNEESLEAGRGYLSQHALFGTMDRSIHVGDRNLLGRYSAIKVSGIRHAICISRNFCGISSLAHQYMRIR